MYRMDRYKVVDDIIYYKGCVYLVPESTLKENIMRSMHDTPLVGHSGYFKTYMLIRERFAWNELKDECEGVSGLSTEKIKEDPYYMITIAITHSKVEVGKHIHRLHHMFA
jgi:hypothetical protein